MRNLIFLVKRYYNFFIFLLLQVICWIIVFSNNTFQQSSYINSSRSITGKIYKQKNKVMGFFSLSNINDSLIKENAQLKMQLGHKLPANPLKDTSYTVSTAQDSMRTTIFYKYIPAKVLNNTIDQKRNYITINKGLRDGIKPKMAVISDRGIVGRVSHVNNQYSVILSTLSDHLPVSAMAPDGTVGKVFWGGNNPELATLTGIPQSVKLKKGDTIYTTSYSFFPERIMIGRVVKQKNLQYTLKLSTNFLNLHYVYVVEDITNIERIIFEDSVKTLDADE